MLTPPVCSPSIASHNRAAFAPLASTMNGDTTGSSAIVPFLQVTSPPSSEPSSAAVTPPDRPPALSLKTMARPSISLPSVAALLAGSADQVRLTIPASPAVSSRNRSPSPLANLKPLTIPPRRRSRRSEPTPAPPPIDPGNYSRQSLRHPQAYPVAPAFHAMTNPAFGHPAAYPPGQLHYHLAEEVATLPASMYEGTMYRTQRQQQQQQQQMFPVPTYPAHMPPPGMMWQTWHPGPHGYLLPMPPPPPPPPQQQQQQQQQLSPAPAGRPRSVGWSDGHAAAAVDKPSTSSQQATPTYIEQGVGESVARTRNAFVAG